MELSVLSIADKATGKVFYYGGLLPTFKIKGKANLGGWGKKRCNFP